MSKKLRYTMLFFADNSDVGACQKLAICGKMG
jgi:hypothetical protein